MELENGDFVSCFSTAPAENLWGPERASKDLQRHSCACIIGLLVNIGSPIVPCLSDCVSGLALEKKNNRLHFPYCIAHFNQQSFDLGVPNV